MYPDYSLLTVASGLFALVAALAELEAIVERFVARMSRGDARAADAMRGLRFAGFVPRDGGAEPHTSSLDG